MGKTNTVQVRLVRQITPKIGPTIGQGVYDAEDLGNNRYRLKIPYRLPQGELTAFYIDVHQRDLVVQAELAVVQQGGSSTELYIHGFDSQKDADKYRRSCDRASYRTSEAVLVPVSLAQHPDFWSVVQDILDATKDLNYSTEVG